MPEQQRIGLFGGTFDPVHNGHLAVARLAARKVLLDQVIFIPAADPPHKHHAVTPFSHRVAMLELALAREKEQFSLSCIEAQRVAPSYTVDTLKELKRLYVGHSLFFIIGADSLLELHLWYRYQQLFDLSDFIVVSRPGITENAVVQAIENLPGVFVRQKHGFLWKRSDRATIEYLPDGTAGISSSSLRKLLQTGSTTHLLPEPVFKYIEHHQLYQDY
jgi:nicotinate-nucleotide adenylyltransferase